MGLRNKRDFREAVLQALDVNDDKDVENEYNFKSAVLEAMGVDFVPADIRDFEIYRAKLVEGLGNMSSGGGGGSSDFSTAEITFEGIGGIVLAGMPKIISTPFDALTSVQDEVHDETYTIALYKGKAVISLDPSGGTGQNVATSGAIELLDDSAFPVYLVTGDCTITIS